MQDFVHLHVHTQYSLLDGQAGIAALVDKAIKNGMKGIAITDHGNMFGVKEFYNYVSKKNEQLSKTDGSRLFKPIIGCEMYVAHRTMDKKEGKPDQSGYHLVVLAKNKKGYHNLIKLVSRAWTEGHYMRPRTDRNELEKYHEGLIV
ncbi:DNA polymerase III subunit alpha, partial [termite gut metagenome]